MMQVQTLSMMLALGGEEDKNEDFVGIHKISMWFFSRK